MWNKMKQTKVRISGRGISCEILKSVFTEFAKVLLLKLNLNQILCRLKENAYLKKKNFFFCNKCICQILFAEDELDLIFAKVFSAEFGTESFQKLLTSDEILSFFAINE